MAARYLSRFAFSAVNVLRQTAAFCVAIARRFYDDQCLMRASALAYTSLLSIVPFFALMFAVLKGLGVQHRLEPLLLSRLALQPETASAMIDYIDRTNVSTLGSLGAAALVLTVISVLGSIEASLNHIWRVVHGRSVWRKVTEYLSVVLLTPFLLLVAVTITSSLQVQQLLGWLQQRQYLGEAAGWGLHLVPVLFNIVAIGALYAIMPNRRQSPAALLVGAVVAGAAWQAVQVTYVRLQIGMAGYSAIYGALSQVPVTLVWLYVSWTVVLAGAEVSAVCEFGVAPRPGADGRLSPAAVALHLLVRVARAFAAGERRIDARTIARELDVGVDVVGPVGHWMVERGWMVVDDDTGRWLLGRDAGGIELAELASLDTPGAVPAACDASVRLVCETVSGAGRAAWAGLRLADVLGLDGAPGGAPTTQVPA
jgi:membrane protein